MRWWDGRAWTTHVATGGRTFEDALTTTARPTAPVVEPAQPRVRQPRPPRAPHAAPSRNGLAGAAAVVALVLGVGIFVGTKIGGSDTTGGTGGGKTAVDVLGAGEPAPGLSGYLDLGGTTPPVTATVGPAGSTIAAPDGVSIAVPKGTHTADVAYSVTETDIVGHSFGEAVSPISKLLVVDNGSATADQPITVTFPAEVPAGKFAMAVFYDQNTGRLEPLPLIDSDGTSVVVATRHFSSIFVTVIDIALLLDGVLDSGFRPGVDSWQFVNYGSYVESGGHCSGQSLSALWYYDIKHRAEGAPALFGAFDDRIEATRLTSTSTLQWDDRDGYRLASMVQHDQYAGGASAYELEMRELSTKRFDRLQYYAFAYAILLTGEPQFVGIFSSAGGGHAMIVYAVTKDALLISDPNYPSEYREIPWNDAAGVLGPYEAQANAATAKHLYETVGYYAKSALVDWTSLGTRWQQFLDGTIGNDTFPSGALEVREEDADGNEIWVPLADGYKVDQDTTAITVRNVAPTFNDRQRVYRWDTELVTGGWDAPVDVPLVKGANRLGFETQGWIWSDSSVAWVDFERLNVMRGEPDELPLDLIFVIDLTSSMEDDIDGVKAAAKDIVQSIAATSSDWRVAIVGYRDVGDEPMFEDYAFSADEGEVIANIDALSVFGGGDTPEAVYEAMLRAIDASTIDGWRAGVNKQTILMGDAPPHDPGSGGETAEQVAQAAEDADPVVIQSVIVGNAGVIDPDAQASFADLSSRTKGSTFTAADAAAVPAALQQSIGATAVSAAATPGDSSDWPRTLLLVVSLLLLVGGAGVVVWRLLRPPTQPEAAAAPTP